MKISYPRTIRWYYLLVLVPFFTDLIENKHFPTQSQEFVTEIVVSTLIAIGVFIIYKDIDKIRILSETDALTGLYNRRRFTTDIIHEVSLSRRVIAPLSLVYIDVNDFKGINDNHGHAEGDAVLREIGILLRNTARRDYDFCYRLGGDEFGLLLIGVTQEQAEEMISQAQVYPSGKYPHLQANKVTLSYGVVQLGEFETEDAFLKRADAIMYWRKEQHKKNKDNTQHSKLASLT